MYSGNIEEVLVILEEIKETFQNIYKMYRRQRYFKNSLPDYRTSGQNERTFVQDLIKSYVQQIEQRFKPIPQNAVGGLYLGVAGVAFMFLKMACSEPFQEKRQELLGRALTYIQV